MQRAATHTDALNDVDVLECPVLEETARIFGLEEGAPHLTDAAREVLLGESPALLEQRDALPGFCQTEGADRPAEPRPDHEVVVSALHQRRVTSLW
jgi:hypothetical protein